MRCLIIKHFAGAMSSLESALSVPVLSDFRLSNPLMLRIFAVGAYAGDEMFLGGACSPFVRS